MLGYRGDSIHRRRTQAKPGTLSIQPTQTLRNRSIRPRQCDSMSADGMPLTPEAACGQPAQQGCQRRQKAGESSTSTVKISNRPSSIATTSTHLLKSLILE